MRAKKKWEEWYDVYYSTAPQQDVRFYVELARNSGGPVLEIGVGTGRIAIPTARAGIDVTGIDLHAPMLQRAAEKAGKKQPGHGNLRLVEADMRNMNLGQRYPIVTIPANTLLLADNQEDQIRTLQTAAAHLHPDGRLAFDVFIPDPAALAQSQPEPLVWAETAHPDTGNRVVISAISAADAATQINRETQIFEEFDHQGRLAGRAELDVTIRYLFPAEVHALVEQAGLAVEQVFGGFDRSKPSHHSEEFVYLCRTATA